MGRAAGGVTVSGLRALLSSPHSPIETLSPDHSSLMSAVLIIGQHSSISGFERHRALRLVLLDAFPGQYVFVLRRPQDDPVIADKLEAPHNRRCATGVDVACSMVRDGLCVSINRVSAEICRVAVERFLRFFGCWLSSGEFRPRPIGHDLRGHVAALVIDDETCWFLTARGTRRGNKSPHADESIGDLILRRILPERARDTEMCHCRNGEQANSKSHYFAHRVPPVFRKQ